MILLLDVDGVLQFKHPECEPALVARYAITGDFVAFQRDLFSDPIYSQTLVGQASFLSLLQTKLDQAGITADAQQFTREWLMGAVLHNHELLEFAASLEHTRVCLATNQEPQRGAHIRSSYAALNCFERIYQSHELGYRKPDPRYFQQIVQDLAAPLEEFVFVDDFPHNVEGATRAGITAIRFESTPQVIADLRKLGIR